MPIAATELATTCSNPASTGSANLRFKRMLPTIASSFATGRMRELASAAGFGGLEVHEGPAAARDLSTYAEDGTYRFAKGQTNLKRGWVMVLER